MISILTRRVPAPWLIGAIVLIPAGVSVAWWYYWPTYHRRQLLAAAERAIESDKPAEARESLEKLLKHSKVQKSQPAEEARVHYLYAQVLRRLGEGDNAWEHLRIAVEGGLPEPEGRREYALLEAGGNFSLAENVLRRVLDDYPNDSEVLQVLAQGYVSVGRWPDAEKIYTRWLEVQPDRMETLLARGNARLEAGGLDQAAADFREVLLRSPNHFQARLSLAQCLLNNLKVDEAQAELDRCHAMLPARSEPLVGLAACALERGDLDKAQTLTKEALALDGNSRAALTVLGIIHLRRQRYDLAIPIFEAVVRLSPRDKQAHLNLAQAFHKQGDLEKAKEHESIFQKLDTSPPTGIVRNP
ncbi:MAG TPA: tetratricopeptide repeat protein [Gemmataceae bacterium]|nr:tetratricopeptide repeat protein [Gemmataceae bacterium]